VKRVRAMLKWSVRCCNRCRWERIGISAQGHQHAVYQSLLSVASLVLEYGGTNSKPSAAYSTTALRTVGTEYKSDSAAIRRRSARDRSGCSDADVPVADEAGMEAAQEASLNTCVRFAEEIRFFRLGVRQAPQRATMVSDLRSDGPRFCIVQTRCD